MTVKLCRALFLTGARLLSCQCPVLKQFTESIFTHVKPHKSPGHVIPFHHFLSKTIELKPAA